MQRGLTQYKKNLNEAYQLSKKGAVQNDWWTDIQPILSPTAKEQTGYPTQKPLALYSRIIKASPNENDIVLDPFAGCAITLVAAEIVGRKWVGMDIWENAKSVIVERMEREGLIQKGRQAKQGNLFARDIHFTDRPPERTDEGDEAVLFLRVRERVREPDGPRWTRREMYEYLLTQYGYQCMGCNRTSDDDPRCLELDHNTPRSDGGLNHISNRILLCGPCNRLKSNTFTLSGLRRENRKLGHMKRSQTASAKANFSDTANVQVRPPPGGSATRERTIGIQQPFTSGASGHPGHRGIGTSGRLRWRLGDRDRIATSLFGRSAPGNGRRNFGQAGRAGFTVGFPFPVRSLRRGH